MEAKENEKQLQMEMEEKEKQRRYYLEKLKLWIEMKEKETRVCLAMHGPCMACHVWPVNDNIIDILKTLNK